MFKLFKSKSAMAASIAVLTVATPFVAREEGLRTKAYLDSVGIATICYGETEGVKLGDTKTLPECNAMLYAKLGAMSALVDHLIEVPMTVNAHAAFTSWVYNVGPNAARKSTLVKIANTGNIRGACEQLPRWKYAGGEPILLGRRMRELQLCLTGL
jgi:GH24 family phage-related lysozyme (muramidase)